MLHMNTETQKHYAAHIVALTFTTTTRGIFFGRINQETMQEEPALDGST